MVHVTNDRANHKCSTVTRMFITMSTTINANYQDINICVKILTHICLKAKSIFVTRLTVMLMMMSSKRITSNCHQNLKVSLQDGFDRLTQSTSFFYNGKGGYALGDITTCTEGKIFDDIVPYMSVWPDMIFVTCFTPADFPKY